MGMNAWAPERRRSASMAVTLLALALIGFAVLGWLVNSPQMELFLLVILVALVVALVFQLLVVLTGRGQALQAPSESPVEEPWASESGGAAPEPWQPAGSAPAAENITLKCSNCNTVFDVVDSGARPLVHKCPGCGLQGELTEEDIGPAPVRSAPPQEVAMAEPPAAAVAAAPTLTLKCGNCGTVFDIADTGARPLRHTCPGCGLEGELTEAELGPPPVAAPPMAPAVAEPAWASPAPAPAPAPAVSARPMGVRTLRLRCKSCQTVFTVRDTGARPLYHECPGCKATGVLR